CESESARKDDDAPPQHSGLSVSELSGLAHLLGELPQHCDAGSSEIANLRANCSSRWNENIDSRSESNHSHSVALSNCVTDFRVSDDPARDEAGYLPHENSRCACFDSDGHLLILQTRLFRRGVDEFPLVVMYVADDAIDRITIH